MSRKGKKGSITVFLSLSCILFLSLICAVIESARVQGAKAQTANIVGMGTFSLLGEFEKVLLEKYNIFSLDGTYGSGVFSMNKVNDRLKEFMSYNTDPKKDVFSLWSFDPWNLELTNSRISEYALLTDETGEPFYQQAVAYMKENAAVIAVERLAEYASDVDLIEQKESEYENTRKENDKDLNGLEKEKNDRIEQMQSEAEESPGTEIVPAENVNNPLKEIARLRKKSTLEIVTWGKSISGKKINIRNFPSRGVSHKGNMKIEKKYGGYVDNLLFREYLMTYFPDYVDNKDGNALNYQLEYILGGKGSDKSNLKYVVNRLLLMREGLNYGYCASDFQISLQAESLAVSLTGFLGIPALTIATKHALLLAWAYGESLIDVRVLLDGGKVPLFKDTATWCLSLENLGRITQILQAGARGSGTGMTYDEYLRILLNMGNISKQRMRALDMIQAELQREEETKSYKADNCIVAVKADANWECKPVFSGLPRIVFGASAGKMNFQQQSSLTY